MATVTESAVNYWPQSKCAKAFWTQQEIPPYKQLLRDTAAWFDPQPGESWLDLGCGCGKLTEALWNVSEGRVGAVVGVDVASVNEKAYEKLRVCLHPTPGKKIGFVTHDLSTGLSRWATGSIDGIVSGLALQYAECYNEARHEWTTSAYDQLLAEMHRVLRVGGRLIFSVNVPNPSWWKVAWRSIHGVFAASRPLKYIKNSLRMMQYGQWLTHEARRGRFHYLPLQTQLQKLAVAGFNKVEYRRSFADQAFIFRCIKD